MNNSMEHFGIKLFFSENFKYFLEKMGGYNVGLYGSIKALGLSDQIFL